MEVKPYHELSDRQKRRRISKKISAKETVCSAAQQVSDVVITDDSTFEQHNSFFEEENSDTSPEDSDTSPQDCESSAELETDFEYEYAVESKIEAAIRSWYVECPNIPRSTVSKLLKNLHKHFHGVHVSANTVLGNEKLNCEIDNVFCGRVVTILDWVEDLKNHLNSIEYSRVDIELNINIDGIPLFNDKRNHTAYPILIQCCSEPSKIFCAGFYLSENGDSNKMPDVNLFLVKFVSQMKELLLNQLVLKNTLTTITIKALVCDAPARADLKRIVGHAAYSSCERCIQKGSRAGGHTALLNMNAPKRTSKNFLEKQDIDHHKKGELSILNELNIDPVQGFALDYMHLVCIGVVKRLLTRMKSSKTKQKKCHIAESSIEEINSKIKEYHKNIPSEFARKLNGGLGSLAFWKSTEHRLFLLYVGPVVLKNFLPDEQYINFMYLSLSMRFLLSEGQTSNIPSIQSLLKNFIASSRNIYGDDFISYNVHHLIHLPDDYLKWGPLDSVSCFPFENYLGHIIKGRLCGKNKILEEIARHVTVENKRKISNSLMNCSNSISISGKKIVPQRLPLRDNIILLNSNNIGYVKSVNGQHITAGIFQKDQPLFMNPVNSEVAGIYLLKCKTKECIFHIDDILAKCMLLPYNAGFVAIQMLK